MTSAMPAKPTFLSAAKAALKEPSRLVRINSKRRGKHSIETLTLQVSAFFWLLTGWSAFATCVSTLTIIFMVNWQARFEVGAIRGELAKALLEQQQMEEKYMKVLEFGQAKQDTVFMLQAKLKRGGR